MTTITISDETWKRLNALKNVGDSFDKVLNQLLDEHEKCREDKK